MSHTVHVHVYTSHRLTGQISYSEHGLPERRREVVLQKEKVRARKDTTKQGNRGCDTLCICTYWLHAATYYCNGVGGQNVTEMLF